MSYNSLEWQPKKPPWESVSGTGILHEDAEFPQNPGASETTWHRGRESYREFFLLPLGASASTFSLAANGLSIPHAHDRQQLSSALERPHLFSSREQPGGTEISWPRAQACVFFVQYAIAIACGLPSKHSPGPTLLCFRNQMRWGVFRVGSCQGDPFVK